MFSAFCFLFLNVDLLKNKFLTKAFKYKVEVGLAATLIRSEFRKYSPTIFKNGFI